MLFNSHIFILAFLPITLIVYLLLCRLAPRHLVLPWLVIASLVYLGYHSSVNLKLLFFSLEINFFLGMYLNSAKPGALKKTMLTLGVLFNLSTIGYFKYGNFLVDNFNLVSGTDYTLGHVILPIGISFYTFQQIAFLVDSYKGQGRECSFVEYCLFVVYFPQLIAGPIVHHQEMLPQFLERGRYRFDPRDLSLGVSIFIVGLCKKVFVADMVSGFSTPIFAIADGKATGPLSIGVAWVAALAWAFQLYFDFSAYSDMAIGIGRMFGIRLPLNFNSPYKAHNIIDFWRRWHITLSRFLRDYIYIPLGGNRKGKTRRHVNLMITMLLGGLWHGAGWNFVLWGGLHGLYLMINHGWHVWRGVKPNDPPRSLAGLWLGRIITFLAVLFAWVFFRAETFDGAIVMLSAMAGRRGFYWSLPEGMGLAPLALAGCFVLVWCMPHTMELFYRFKPAIGMNKPKPVTPAGRRFLQCLAWRPNWPWALALAGAFMLAMLYLNRISEFIYFQF